MPFDFVSLNLQMQVGALLPIAKVRSRRLVFERHDFSELPR